MKTANALWIGYVLLFLLVPLLYGWAWRGWGPPIPERLRRPPPALRRGRNQPKPKAKPPGWSGLAEVWWGFVLIALVWLGLALLRG